MASAAPGLMGVRRGARGGVRARLRARFRRALPVSLSLVLGACSVIPIPLSLPGAAHPTPIADRPIDLVGNCVQIEDDGFRENAQLTVRDNRVLALDWTMQVGRRGSCGFRQAEFRQTKTRPHIELLARDGSGCRLMVWQDPRRITLAHAGCESRCTPGIYDEAWPVMFDPATGRCARP